MRSSSSRAARRPNSCRRQVAAALEPVGLVDVLDAGHGQQALLVHELHAAQAGAGNGAAVVAVPAADDDVALRLPFQLPVAAHQPDDGVDRIRCPNR